MKNENVVGIDSTPKAFGVQVNRPYQLPVIGSPSAGCIDDTWAPTTLANTPDGRYRHKAVWTGTEMIVWGGTNGSYLNTGGRYNPITDSWSATSTINAPSARSNHTAVWTGNEMIVWGGTNGAGSFNTGGRYNPITDSWSATSTINALSARSGHTAVWTGNEMIVWGPVNTGGRYNPSTDSWTATSTINASTARTVHTAVWTDSEMIVWGGINGSTTLNTGGRYTPSTDSWTATSTTNAPSARGGHTAIWTGSEMIVWGGCTVVGINGCSNLPSTGGRYIPHTDTWTATSTTNVPSARWFHTAVLTGSEMIVWGGLASNGAVFNTGGRYDPVIDSWRATSTTNAPSARAFHTAVWTVSEMIVWGGYNNITFFNTGGRYCAQSGSPTITLSAAKRKVGGVNTVRLTWSGATSANIDVYRNNVLITTTTNTGTYTDSTGDTGRAQYIYHVCEAGASTCSNDVEVVFRH